MNSLSSGSNDICPLFLDKIQVATLPKKCSRHNAPSRAHALSKLVKSTSNIGTNTRQTIVIVCERSEVFASGCAIARCFPTFTRKTISKSQEVNTSVANVPKVLGHKVQVEFIIVDENNQAGLSANDVETLGQSAKAIQLSGNIVIFILFLNHVLFGIFSKENRNILLLLLWESAQTYSNKPSKPRHL